MRYKVIIMQKQHRYALYSYLILKLKSLLFHYFPKILGHSLAVFLCIAYIRKDLSQCFFIIFCDKLLILRQRFLIGIQTVDILRSIIMISFFMDNGLQRQAVYLVQESLPASLR